MLSTLDRLISRIALSFAVIAGANLIAIALIVMLEVVMRLLNSPLVGGIELIRIVFVVSVFFAFAQVIVREREVRVDVMRQFAGDTAGRVLDVGAGVFTFAFFALFLWFSSVKLIEAWTHGVYMEGRLLIPMWIPWATIVLGSALSVTAALLAIVKRIAGGEH